MHARTRKKPPPKVQKQPHPPPCHAALATLTPRWRWHSQPQLDGDPQLWLTAPWRSAHDGMNTSTDSKWKWNDQKPKELTREYTQYDQSMRRNKKAKPCHSLALPSSKRTAIFPCHFSLSQIGYDPALRLIHTLIGRLLSRSPTTQRTSRTTGPTSPKPQRTWWRSQTSRSGRGQTVARSARCDPSGRRSAVTGNHGPCFNGAPSRVGTMAWAHRCKFMSPTATMAGALLGATWGGSAPYHASVYQCSASTKTAQALTVR